MIHSSSSTAGKSEYRDRNHRRVRGQEMSLGAEGELIFQINGTSRLVSIRESYQETKCAQI